MYLKKQQQNKAKTKKKKKKKRKKERQREKRRGTEQDSNPAPSAPRDFTLPLPVHQRMEKSIHSQSLHAFSIEVQFLFLLDLASQCYFTAAPFSLEKH